MNISDVQDAINNNRKAMWNGAEYLVIGYKLIKDKDGKHHSVGLMETKRNTIYWVEIGKVEIVSGT